LEIDRISALISVTATFLGSGHFILQQHLAETSLFKALFTEFNKRYDKLNGKLAEIAASKPERKPLDNKERETVIDYFNLCAEEYLFYKRGYIDPDVWRAWCNGMLWYMEQEPFATLWEEEKSNNSYYGLSLNVIRSGAK